MKAREYFVLKNKIIEWRMKELEISFGKIQKILENYSFETANSFLLEILEIERKKKNLFDELEDFLENLQSYCECCKDSKKTKENIFVT